MPQALELTRFSLFITEMEELINEMNQRVLMQNDYFRDIDGIAGLSVVLDDNGLLSDTRIETVTADTTVDATHRYVMVDASGGAVEVRFPAVADSKGLIYTVKKTDSSGNAVTLNAAAVETIDGATTKTLSSQYDFMTIVCDGSEWWIIAQ